MFVHSFAIVFKPFFTFAAVVFEQFFVVFTWPLGVKTAAPCDDATFVTWQQHHPRSPSLEDPCGVEFTPHGGVRGCRCLIF